MPVVEILGKLHEFLTFRTYIVSMKVPTQVVKLETETDQLPNLKVMKRMGLVESNCYPKFSLSYLLCVESEHEYA